MIKAVEGKWTTKDGQAFYNFDDAVLHNREIVLQEAIDAGYTTKEQIKTFRRRYWVLKDVKKEKQVKVSKKN